MSEITTTKYNWDNLIEELQLIRNCLTILCYYTGKNFFSNEPTLEEVKELIACI